MSEGGLTADSLRGSSPPAGPRVVTALDASDILTSSASMSARTPVREATPLRLADPPPPEPDEPPQERTRLRLVSGKIIPGTRYRLRRWLGEGGMGVVYEAEHVDIERRVALKILRFDLSRNPEMIRVFRDEARAVSKTGHPNIVEVYDFGELPDGRLFMCMELLDGADLVPATETTALPVADVIAIFRQLCKGLGAAHRAGVVHRDVKPENILICKKLGRDGVVKIVDFGISAILGNRFDPKKIAGTPHYMAPEQIRGKPFDGRLDQYAAGCVAFELLTGRPPFPGEVLEQVLLAHCDAPPPTLKDARPDLQIPAALEQVIARCLAKKPEDRFPSMDEVEAALCEAQIAAGLRTAFDDLPLPDVAPERQARLRERMPSPHTQARRRWLWPLVAGLSILIAAGTVAAMALTREPPPIERSHIDRLAEEALVAATRTAYVAPPAGEPDAPTAYAKVLELEAIDDPSSELADLRAAELRQQFAEGLVALGDKYWDVAAARPFAVEYYIWARTFEPDNPRATERSGMTPGAFTRFQEKARTGSWSLGELQALGLVSALADDDAARREQRVLAAHADASQLSVFQHLDLDQGLRGAGIKLPPKKSLEPAVVAPPPIESPPPIVDPLPELGPDEPADAAPHEPGKSAKKSAPKSRRDPAKAKDLAEKGAAALKAGRRGDAESFFHQAIFYDNRNAKALMGLSDIYFDTGAKQKAVQFAELAVEAAPVSRTYHLKLGDAYFVVLRYRDAIKHYEEALELGEHSAQSRIDKVKKLIGP